MVRVAVFAFLLSAIHANAQELIWPVAGESIVVTLKDARTISGVVSPDTTSTSLSLARTQGGLSLKSDFPRTKIDRIEKRPPPVPAESEPSRQSEMVEERTTFVRPSRLSKMKVSSISVRARLANWDNDAEPDGLLVEVSPFDALGNFVPAAGNIDLELYGERHQQGSHTYDSREAFTLLDRNATRLRQSDAGSDSFVVRFPFRRFHPDRNLEVSSTGLMRARLSVPSQGVFEASDDWVTLQQPSRFRDDVQHLTGKRYLNQEGVNLHKPFDVSRASP